MSYSSLPTFAFQLSKCASSLIHSAPVTHYNFLRVQIWVDNKLDHLFLSTAHSGCMCTILGGFNCKSPNSQEAINVAFMNSHSLPAPNFDSIRRHTS